MYSDIYTAIAFVTTASYRYNNRESEEPRVVL